jgi:hypothetical protein
LISFVKQIERDTVLPIMKKVISISLTILVLAAMLHVSVATHYCGGMKATSKISLSGKLATCGMEDDKRDLPFTGPQFSTHCCDNIIAFVGVNGNYFPSFVSVGITYLHLIHVLDNPVKSNLRDLASLQIINTNESPPGAPASSVELSGICVFRI